MQDGPDGRVRRSLAVGVLDPEQHLAAMLVRIEPVEQGCAGASDMEKAGWRGGKAGDDWCGHRRQQDGGGICLGRLGVYSRNPI